MRFLYRLDIYVSRVLSLLYTKAIALINNNIVLGEGTFVYYRASVINLSRSGGVKIGKGCVIGVNSIGYHAGMPYNTKLLNDGENSYIIVGNNCRINGACIHAEKRVIIGNNCVIASGVTIIDSNGHEINSHNRTKGRDNPAPIEIGNNVWVGINSVILKGTKLGDNCVISAGSVVKGVFPAGSLIRGNPAIVDGEIRLNFNNN